MKSLGNIIKSIDHHLIKGDYETPVSDVHLDSRKVTNQSLFIAIPGTKVDGHQYIDRAVEAGARTVICMEEPENKDLDVTLVKVPDTMQVAGVIASRFFDNPSEKLRVVGVTGTNGKTSVVFILSDLFTHLGKKVGMLSTVRNEINGKILPAKLTTPDAISLQKLLSKMVESRCEYAFMEVSSHAIHQHRVSGISFAGAVFTNISQDHLDYHGSFRNYIYAKKALFDQLPADGFALVNIDDRNGKVMVQNTKAQVYSYALQKAADYKGKIMANEAAGLHLMVDGIEVHTTLVGSFNASNLVAAYGVGSIFGVDRMKLLELLTQVSPPPGRLESIWDESRKILAFVDYAHTPDALQNVLQTLTRIKDHQSKITTVVGCGGDRDRGKRPLMARIACNYSDRVILTSDNPRTEDPHSIIAQMMDGVDEGSLSKTVTIENRREAIRAAYMMTPDNGIILIAGKGHENYQEIKGKRYPFDDMEVIKECFTVSK